MPTIKLNSGGNIITKDGKPSCTCCEETFELAIKYDWTGTGQYDLDTKTEAFGEQVGWACGDSGTYVLWLRGGVPCSSPGVCDDTSQNGFERVDVRVDLARTNGLWTSSYNILCYAGWYAPAGGSGSASLEVRYKGDVKTISISPGTQSYCAETAVATITVYAAEQMDGTYFEII